MRGERGHAARRRAPGRFGESDLRAIARQQLPAVLAGHSRTQVDDAQVPQCGWTGRAAPRPGAHEYRSEDAFITRLIISTEVTGVPPRLATVSVHMYSVLGVQPSARTVLETW